MYCENCGAKLNDNEKFCPFCGAKTETTEQTPDIPRQPEYQPPRQPEYQPPRQPAYQPPPQQPAYQPPPQQPAYQPPPQQPAYQPPRQPAYPQQPKPPAKSGMKAVVIVLAVLLAAAVVLVTLFLTGVLSGKKPIGGKKSVGGDPSAQSTDAPEPTPRHTEPGITPGTAESALPEPSAVPETPAPTSGKMSVQDKSITVDLAFSSGTGVYTGEVDENGLPDGYGVFFMESDDVYGDTWNYIGMWKHGHLCGEGVLESMNGRLTESGNFQNDLLNGSGTMTFDGILRYDGKCKDGKFWGYGKLYTESGILLFEGEFEDDQLKDASDREILLEKFIDDYLCMDDFLDLWPDYVETDDTVWALYGDITAVGAQYEDGIVIVDVPADNDEGYITVALHYLYAVDEYRIDEEDDEALAVWGYYVGTYEIDVDDVLTAVPKIEVIYWTTD